MEDFRLDIMIDQGPNARSVRLTLPRFTLVGATTRAGLLTAPLRSRFTLQTRLDYYDHATLKGIGIHADEAAVNVNFWITPDAGCLNPDTGGMVVWDKAAPMAWDFTKANADEAAAYDFLEKAGAKSITIPYRDNRAVIFDSNLFHRTGDIEFAPGYLNRRINVTMLYGRRA
jgi:hypothetical protein